MEYRVAHLRSRRWFKVRVWRTPEKHSAIRALLKKVLPDDAFMCHPVQRDPRVDRNGRAVPRQFGLLIMLATYEDVITARLACDLRSEELLGWDDWAQRHEKSADLYLMCKYRMTPERIALRRIQKGAKKLARNK